MSSAANQGCQKQRDMVILHQKSHRCLSSHVRQSIKTKAKKYLLTLGLPCYKWWSKMDFNRQSHNNWKFSIIKPMAIKNVWLPTLRRLKFFNCLREHGGGDLFFSRMILHTPPPPLIGDQKHFNHHLTYHYWMTIEILGKK